MRRDAQSNVTLIELAVGVSRSCPILLMWMLIQSNAQAPGKNNGDNKNACKLQLTEEEIS